MHPSEFIDSQQVFCRIHYRRAAISRGTVKSLYKWWQVAFVLITPCSSGAA